MSNENSQALAPTAAADQAVATAPPSFLSVFGTDDRPCVMSFDPKTAAGGELLQRCEEEPDTSLRELANLELTLQHVYAKVFDFSNPQTGEVYPLLRICLVTTDGKIHACCADGVRESILRLMQRHGVPPWLRGVKVTVKLKPTKKGFNRLVLLEHFDKPKGGK